MTCPDANLSVWDNNLTDQEKHYYLTEPSYLTSIWHPGLFPT